MPGRELISRRTRTEFREVLSGWGTLRVIDKVFENEGFSADPTHVPNVSGQRRTLVEQYYSTIDFGDARQVQRLLRVYEDVLRDLDRQSPDDATKLRSYLERDGCRLENDRILLANAHLRLQELDAIAQALDAGEILAQIGRIETAIETDPSLAIGTAKELVESCCKTILADRNVTVDRNIDLPQLIKATMKELQLLPDSIPDSARGADTIRRMLSNLGSVVSGLAEIRNLYGSGHGRSGKTKGLSPRHAKLAAGTAGVLTVFLFETHQQRAAESPEPPRGSSTIR